MLSTWWKIIVSTFKILPQISPNSNVYWVHPQIDYLQNVHCFRLCERQIRRVRSTSRSRISSDKMILSAPKTHHQSASNANLIQHFTGIQRNTLPNQDLCERFQHELCYSFRQQGSSSSPLQSQILGEVAWESPTAPSKCATIFLTTPGLQSEASHLTEFAKLLCNWHTLNE